jgi:iron complex transport system substrate-binding protein
MRRIRALLAAIPLALAGCGSVSHERTGGIVSTNPCADATLVELVPPERITAISSYSRDPRATSMPLDVARRFPTTSGTAEEVIALRPALVLASDFTPPSTLSAYRRAGLRTLVLPISPSLAASEQQVMQIARAVGEIPRGQALVAHMRRAVAAAKPSYTEREPEALLFLSGNLANGAGTLLDEMMRRAGLRNGAARFGLAVTNDITNEALLAHPPQAILSAENSSRPAHLRRAMFAASGARVRDIPFPGSLMNCGGPVVIPAMARLAEIRRGLQP